MESKVRLAASVLLVRPAAGGRSAATAARRSEPTTPVEVFLVERSPKLRFFGGYHALPGGILEAVDQALCEKHPAGAGAPAGGAAVWAAIRELFEETGVLAGVGEPASRDLAAGRQRLLAGAIDFAGLLAEWGMVPDPSVLRPLCAITTPPFAPVRFATQFFWLELPPGSAPSIVPGELVGGAFVAPADALGAWRRGSLALAPPIVMLLDELAALPAGTAVGDLARRAAAIDAQAYGSPGRRIYFSPGVQILPLPTRTKPPATHTNTLLIGREQLWIVDPAPPDPEPQALLFAAVDSVIAEGGCLAGVLLTHHHPDHVGAVRATVDRYGVTVAGHPETLARTSGVALTRALTGGDVLELGAAPDGSTGWRLEVLDTPGHTMGHLAFRESRYGAVIAGDLVSTLSTIVIDPPEGHLGTYLASLRGLLALAGELGTLYPGHGPPVRDARVVLHQTLRHREERLAKVAAALATGVQSAEELLGRVYDDVDATLWPLARRSLAAGLELLVEQGRAELIGEGWRLPG